jgi:hypothetical protein
VVALLEYLKKNFPDQYARVEYIVDASASTATTIKDGCIVTTIGATSYILKTAQPYVHLAVPLIAGAVDVSQVHMHTIYTHNIYTHTIYA